METAKIFTSGRSQAVRIPKEYRFSSKEVYINKIGDALILTPVESLPSLFDEGLRGFSNDFMVGGRPEEIPSERYGIQ
ncbi:MAG: AbrB/MazE/SpoVT family DNA-binding domain-containing protein [Oscillospiraceae bacterium]|nr:AbrB/MazE/SpoVT family DNA-binding domain-containing protein [Oscillospiraceae bacterium]